MTRKDYIALAAALKETHDGRHVNVETHVYYCEAVADVLARDNGAFDRERFLHACGITEVAS